MNGREYLSFTKRERTGIIALVILVLIAAVVPRFFCKPEPVAENITENDFGKLHSNTKYRNDNSKTKHRDSIGWDHKSNKSNYRKFKPGWGAKEDSYKKYKRDYPTYQKSKKDFLVIDVNSADTTAFISLPGIGSKLASRIISFREKLGGFYNLQQIGEVYGLQDSIFQRIRSRLKCDSGHIRKIDINIAGEDVLKSHPYIRWKIANALVAYRSQHGAFGSAEDLAEINNIDNDALRKMIPYLSFK